MTADRALETLLRMSVVGFGSGTVICPLESAFEGIEGNGEAPLGLVVDGEGPNCESGTLKTTVRVLVTVVGCPPGTVVV